MCGSSNDAGKEVRPSVLGIQTASFGSLDVSSICFNIGSKDFIRTNTASNGP